MSIKADFFHERMKYYEEQITLLTSKYNNYSIFRIIAFVAFATGAIWCLKADLPLPLFILIASFIIGFTQLIRKHSKIKRERALCKKLFDINKEEVQRLSFSFDKIYDGKEFAEEKHEYAYDLDIFGRNSLFQLINRAGTLKGIHLLASWIKRPASRETIISRQNAVLELIDRVKWRQKVQAYGRDTFSKNSSEDAFHTWLQGEDVIISKPFYRILPYVVMVISTVLILGYLYGKFPLMAFILPFIIAGFFLYKIIDYSKTTYEMTQSGLGVLASIENIIVQIEQAEFENPQLKSLQTILKPEGIIASEKIKKLRKIFDWLSLRGNQMYHLFNSIFLLDFILLAKAEKWRANYKHEIDNWFDAVAEFEALNSLAAFAYANDKYAFPEIMEKPFIFHGENIGHPLIPTDSRVDNDFIMENKGAAYVITGSNMAGKSTFLRIVGINAVLAFSGAPVCATSLQLSTFQVFTSMRTKDNLEENISSFYAELLRLKMLLEQINDERPILYLLDEILKGTNSVDRHIGAESLILQLNEMNAFGLVSTHDLELGKLEKKHKKIMNYNFSSSIIGEEIVFDYKLQPGICQSTNASQLMAKVGIKIKSKS